GEVPVAREAGHRGAQALDGLVEDVEPAAPGQPRRADQLADLGADLVEAERLVDGTDLVAHPLGREVRLRAAALLDLRHDGLPAGLGQERHRGLEGDEAPELAHVDPVAVG
ncbi:MAG: hypothetical protein ACK56I_30205, partial [bacterium]